MQNGSKPRSLVACGVWLAGCALLAVSCSKEPSAPLVSPKNQETTQRMACINNLKQIDGAKEQWALENKRTSGSAVNVQAVNGYLRNNQAPMCPAGGTYTYSAVGKLPMCSLGASLGHTL